MSDSAQAVAVASQPVASVPSGVGGWLLLFTVGLLPHVVLAGGRVLAALRGAPGGGGPGLALAALALLGHGAGLALILGRHRLAPAFFTLYLPLTIATAVLTPAVGVIQAAEATRLGMADAARAPAVAASAPARIALGVAVTVLWLGYWPRSRRVRATFGSAGLEALRRRAPAA